MAASSPGKRILAPAMIKLMESNQVDPANDVVFVAMIQRMSNPEQLAVSRPRNGLSGARGPVEVCREGVRNGPPWSEAKVANRLQATGEPDNHLKLTKL